MLVLRMASSSRSTWARSSSSRVERPARELIGPHVLSRLPAHQAAAISGRGFFPHLIAAPFRSGLHEAFAFAIAACLVAAVASWSRGGKVRRPEISATELHEQQEAA